MFAYHLEDKKDQPTTSCHDNGEDTAGGKILRVIQENGCQNVVVVVVRWYGGKHLGVKRYQIIREQTKKILEDMNLMNIAPNMEVAQQPPANTTSGATNTGMSQQTHFNTMHQPDTNIDVVDHLLFNDSVAGKLQVSLLFPKAASRKIWAPNLTDMKEVILKAPVATKTVVIMSGIRDARNGTSIEELSQLVDGILETIKLKSPQATIVLTSLLPNRNANLNSRVNSVNEINKVTLLQFKWCIQEKDEFT